MADTVVIAEEGHQSTGYRFSWGLAIAGGITATAITFFLLTLGSGFGLLLVQPTNSPVPTFLTGGAIYFFVAQAFGFAAGGHLAGRLLAPLPESSTQEEFRAEAHGFVAWAITILATVILIAFGSMNSSTSALYGASKTTDSLSSAYVVDVLFRPTSGTPAGDAASRGEAMRIVDGDLARSGVLNNDDHNRLVMLVASDAGISSDKATARVDDMQTNLRAEANLARKNASYAALWIALSLLFGAFTSMSAAVLARHEDDRESLAVN